MVRRLFVGNLPKDLTQKEFENYFSRFGEIENIKLVRKPNERKEHANSGFGFVTYVRQETTNQVINEKHHIHNITLTVNYSERSANQTFFINGIDGHRKEDLKKYFCKYGQITDVRILENRGFAYVTIAHGTNLESITHEKHQKHEIEGKIVTVERARQKRPNQRQMERRHYRNQNHEPMQGHEVLRLIGCLNKLFWNNYQQPAAGQAMRYDYGYGNWNPWAFHVPHQHQGGRRERFSRKKRP